MKYLFTVVACSLMLINSAFSNEPEVVELDCLSMPSLSGLYLTSDYGIQNSIFIIGEKVKTELKLVSGPEKKECTHALSWLDRGLSFAKCDQDNQVSDSEREYEIIYRISGDIRSYVCSDGSFAPLDSSHDSYQKLIQ